MATFEAQVEALTGIAIGSNGTNPTQTELTQFLIDGVLDVTEKWLIGHPQDREQFTRISAEVTSNGSEKVGRADIIAVVRESGTNNDWRPCRKISPTQQSEVLDTESLSFASKYYPTYMVAEDGAISVFPVPEATTDAFKVYYVNYSPRADNDDSLTHASSGMLYFPQNKTYLVALYAAIKSINNNMAGIVTDLSAFSVSTVIADSVVSPTFTAPDLSGIFNPASSPPSYSEPTVQGGSNELTDVTSGTIGSAEADFDEWFHVTGQYIEDKEDTELAGVQLNKISTYIQAYGQAMQNELNKFNDANVEYQAQLQQVQTEAGLKLQEENQEYAAKLQKYQAEVQAYAAEVNTEVQEQATKLQTESARYQWLQDRAAALQAEYVAAFATPQPAGGGR